MFITREDDEPLPQTELRVHELHLTGKFLTSGSSSERLPMCEPRSKSYQLVEIGFILDAESMGIRQRGTDR